MDIWQTIYNILAFQGTLTLVTLIGAVVVWALYSKQRRDQRRDAAKIILREIEYAESKIPEIRKAVKAAEAGNLPENIRLVTVDSWDTMQYQLEGKLPGDVISTINQFYTYCRLIDESMAFIDGAFSKNEEAVRTNAFRMNAIYLDESVRKLKDNPTNKPSIKSQNDKVLAEMDRIRDSFNKTFPTLYTYRPVKPTNDIKQNLELLPLGLSQGRVGQKLRLASLGPIKRILAGEWIKT